MINVGNKPVLWQIMKIYASYGYNEFILALGYKADYIKDYFLNQKAFHQTAHMLPADFS
jgi:glucose-1-phosphate cytidylyltransferase